jgi:hypothetical protein
VGARLHAPQRDSTRVVDRPAAAEELVKDDSEAVDVAPLVDQMALAGGLLGAHIGGGSQDHALAGERRVDRSAPGEAKVRQSGFASFVEDDI